jgi:CheY-like chemotaxis protein
MTDIKPISVLYVEDDAITRLAVGGFIKRIAVVYLAADGQEGLELFKQYKPDIVVTDMAMPVMGGIEMINRIVELSPDVPIIVTTAYNDAEYRSDKAWATLNKPIVREELIEAIKECSERRCGGQDK